MSDISRHGFLILANFITNFADEAVILPLFVAIACTLAALGWRRGAIAWFAVIGGVFAVVLVLKLFFLACGPPGLRSPSGHTGAAAVVLGGLAVVFGRARHWPSALLTAAFAAALIGASRVILHRHTASEVVVAGVIGMTGAFVLARLAGPPPRGMHTRWLLAVAVVVVVLFHGWHLNAEPRIHWVAMHAARELGVCRGADLPIVPPAHTFDLGSDATPR